MAFVSTLEITNGIAKITLSGDLDAASAPIFRADVETAVARNVRRLALLMQDLSYMASAGLRALVFAKQKMGTGVDIYVIGAQGPVLNTLTMSGFQHSVYIQDTYGG